jgi:glycosyltransferase involved in cell wall biosynthesis
MGLLKELPVPSENKKGWPWHEEIKPAVYNYRNNWPTISIVVPSYNQGCFLEETLRSILLQNYPSIELIVIDGGSKDETVDIIKKYEHWIAYWVSEKDKGQSDAINKGFKKATGEIITWINSDDLLLSGSLHKVAEYFSTLPETIGLIHGGVQLFNEKKQIEERFTYLTPSRESYLGGMVFSQPSAFFKKKWLVHAGYLNNDLHYGMDYDFFMRLSLLCDFYPVKDVFAKYRLHDHSKSMLESNKFIGDWKRSFVSLCKNLSWNEELGFLKNTSLYEDELNYMDAFSFRPDEKIVFSVNKQKTLYFHLGHVLKDLYWTHHVDEAEKILKLMLENFPGSWLKEDIRLKAVVAKLKFPRFVLKSLRKIKRMFK